MAEIGRLNNLSVLEKSAYGYYLDGGNLGKILLPNKLSKGEYKIGDEVSAFIYTDSDEQLTATTQKPLAQVGEFAFLKVVSVGRSGAFLDWGLNKDLYVRLSEQKERMREGQSYVVYIFREPQSIRLAASSKLDHYINPEISEYSEGEQVNILIWERTDMGYKAIINNRDIGLLYHSEIFQKLSVGQKLQAFIKKIRDDAKIDLILEKPGFKKSDYLSEKIIAQLKAENGFLAINDKSSPELIATLFAVSKKKFKVAIGALYKQRRIEFVNDGISLIGYTKKNE